MCTYSPAATQQPITPLQSPKCFHRLSRSYSYIVLDLKHGARYLSCNTSSYTGMATACRKRLLHMFTSSIFVSIYYRSQRIRKGVAHIQTAQRKSPRKLVPVNEIYYSSR